MSGRAQGACSAIADADRQKSKKQRTFLHISLCGLLFQPSLHQFDFELLVGDNFLCQSSHLGILAVQELCFRHIDRRLMMR